MDTAAPYSDHTHPHDIRPAHLANLKTILAVAPTPCPVPQFAVFHIMSGFEIVVGIAGIVSAVVGVKNLISKAIASRKAKKLAIRANEQIAEQQLVAPSKEAQTRFTKSFGKI